MGSRGAAAASAHEPAGRDLLLSHGIPPELAKSAALGGREAWEEFLELDTLLTAIGDGADERLAYQMGYPVTVQKTQNAQK
ncbi:hypothetical protein [Catenulispora pinisilvae]|uniref:hypothetical protein n=1 Tax=Catenulispora pinisilvae TaxID=2705253 RepID=UPI001E3DB813|nr:hypothetical protein [Catenulispora pinisilvae]